MIKEVIQVTDSNFEKEIIKSDIPAMVDFWAEWCAPCKAVSPVIDEIARDYRGKIKVAKVDVDDNSKTTTDIGVMNIPTVIFFKNGREHKRIVGANSRREYEKVIKELIK